MTTAAWIFMTVSVSTVTSLMVWCFWRVLTAPKEPAPPTKDSRGA